MSLWVRQRLHLRTEVVGLLVPRSARVARRLVVAQPAPWTHWWTSMRTWSRPIPAASPRACPRTSPVARPGSIGDPHAGNVTRVARFRSRHHLPSVESPRSGQWSEWPWSGGSG